MMPQQQSGTTAADRIPGSVAELNRKILRSLLNLQSGFFQE
jgi:hypothetical protein